MYLMGIVLALSIIENQSKFVDPTIETMKKVKNEIREVNHEIRSVAEDKTNKLKSYVKNNVLVGSKNALIDPTIEAIKNIKQEMYTLNNEIISANDERKKKILVRLAQLKNQLSCNEGN